MVFRDNDQSLNSMLVVMQIISRSRERLVTVSHIFLLYRRSHNPLTLQGVFIPLAQWVMYIAHQNLKLLKKSPDQR